MHHSSWNRKCEYVLNLGYSSIFYMINNLYILVGSPLSGWISDRIVIDYKRKRGYWYPEDRLRACLYSCFLPLTVLASGLVTTYLPTRTGLILNLVCLFINGIGVRFAF